MMHAQVPLIFQNRITQNKDYIYHSDIAVFLIKFVNHILCLFILCLTSLSILAWSFLDNFDLLNCPLKGKIQQKWHSEIL